MRVAFDARSLSSPITRGWDRYTIGLVNHLMGEGVDVTLLHRARQPLYEEHFKDLPCRMLAVPDRGGLHWEQVALPRALAREKFDLYHAPAERGVPLVAPCPVVLTFHSVTYHSYRDMIRRGLLDGRLSDYLALDRPWWQTAFQGAYMRLQVKRADHLLTPSEFCTEEVVKFLGVPRSRVTTTPLALHSQFLREPSSKRQRLAVLARLGVEPPYLLYVGGYEPHKNVGGLMTAFADIHRARPDLRLVLVGTHSVPESLVERAAAHQLVAGKDVIFLRDLSEELTDLYDSAELFVSLSWRETFCLPALEATSRGVPAVLSTWGAAPEVAPPPNRLVDPRDPATAAKVVVELLSRPDRSAISETVRAAANKFSWQATARRTIDIYRQLISEAHANK